jgi:hypothetical protein
VIKDHQNVDGDAVLIHSSSSLMLCPIELEEDLIPVPLRTNAWTFLSQWRGIEGAKLPAPFPWVAVVLQDGSLSQHRELTGIARAK